jgi:hypothetical protein
MPPNVQNIAANKKAVKKVKHFSTALKTHKKPCQAENSGLTFAFSHPDFTVGSGFTPDQPYGSRANYRRSGIKRIESFSPCPKGYYFIFGLQIYVTSIRKNNQAPLISFIACAIFSAW